MERGWARRKKEHTHTGLEVKKNHIFFSFNEKISTGGLGYKRDVCDVLKTSHPRGKLNDIKPTVAANKAVVYCPISDKKKK